MTEEIKARTESQMGTKSRLAVAAIARIDAAFKKMDEGGDVERFVRTLNVELTGDTRLADEAIAEEDLFAKKISDMRAKLTAMLMR